MSRRQRRGIEQHRRAAAKTSSARRRLMAGAGLSLGATLGMTASAEATDYVVTNDDDTDAGSLRQAIANSENGNAPTVDRILFNSGLSGTITLTSGALENITEPLEIIGPGADQLTVSGNDTTRIFSLLMANGGDPVTISGLTLDDGSTLGEGGAIYNGSASLTIRNSTISGSEAGIGGGLSSFGASTSTSIESSTLTGNSSGLGGGVRVRYGEFEMHDSTVSGNTGGGGVALRNNASAPTIEGSTITDNSSPYSGIFARETFDPVVTSTIVANNASDLGVSGGPPPNFDLAFSLVENPGSVGIDQLGPNILGVDPQLGSLAPNGGTTPTHALPSSSPAVDKGSDTGTDQRGDPRLIDFPAIGNAAGGNASDIGAFELQLPSPPLPKCKGITATIVGASRTINGTPQADVIVGTAGKNVIRGRGGRDRICGGKGNDRLVGGAGKDRLFGEAGKDTLIGGRGRDRLVGGPGRDTQRQ